MRRYKAVAGVPIGNPSSAAVFTTRNLPLRPPEIRHLPLVVKIAQFVYTKESRQKNKQRKGCSQT